MNATVAIKTKHAPKPSPLLTALCKGNLIWHHHKANTRDCDIITLVPYTDSKAFLSSSPMPTS